MPMTIDEMVAKARAQACCQLEILEAMPYSEHAHIETYLAIHQTGLLESSMEAADCSQTSISIFQAAIKVRQGQRHHLRRELEAWLPCFTAFRFAMLLSRNKLSGIDDSEAAGMAEDIVRHRRGYCTFEDTDTARVLSDWFEEHGMLEAAGIIRGGLS